MKRLFFVVKVFLIFAAWMSVNGLVSAANLPKKQASLVVELPIQDVDKRPVISEVALSHDGRLMVTAGDDHYVRIWDAKTGEIQREFYAHDDWVRGAVFSPMGDRLVTIGQDGQIKIWNLASLGSPMVIREKVLGARKLVFSPDGTKFAVSGFDPAVYCFDITSQNLLYRLSAPSESMTALQFSPDATLLAAGGRNGIVRIWRMDIGGEVANIKGDGRRVNALAFSPDGSQLALGTNGSRISIWNPRTGSMVSVLPERYGKTFALQYCGLNVLASGESDNIIRLWDLNGKREMTNLVGHTGTVSTMCFDEQLNSLISGGFDTTIRYWAMVQ
ncbi:MAG: WD40 repeat domain-containing protein [Planctomycetaceae bacterium]|nr:WD40 repeat domain-containing protein [Planctomycetaceae bacterium]